MKMRRVRKQHRREKRRQGVKPLTLFHVNTVRVHARLTSSHKTPTNHQQLPIYIVLEGRKTVETRRWKGGFGTVLNIHIIESLNPLLCELLRIMREKRLLSNYAK